MGILPLDLQMIWETWTMWQQWASCQLMETVAGDVAGCALQGTLTPYLSCSARPAVSWHWGCLQASGGHYSSLLSILPYSR